MGVMIAKLTFYAVIALGVLLTLGLMGLILWYFMVYKRRRRWSIEIYEQKTDGRVHAIGRDVIEERTKDWGTKIFYFLKKRRRFALPPPDRLVDRMANGKEEIDYLQLERQMFPAEKKFATNYSDTKVNFAVQGAYDKIKNDIESTTSNQSWFKRFFTGGKDLREHINNKYMYVPLNKILTATLEFKPIPYDVQLTAQRQKEIHEQFFAKKQGFWEKWGGVVLIVVVAIIVMLVVYLSYDFINEVIKQTLSRVDGTVGALDKIADKMGIPKPAS